MPNVTNAELRGESDTLKARLAFLTWLRQTYPQVYSAAVPDATDPYNAQLSGVFDTITGAIGKIDFGKLSDGIIKAGTGYLAIKSQQDLLKLNLQRARDGLPPLDAAAYGQAPVVRTEIDVNPELAARLRTAATMPLLLIGGGLLAFLFLRKR